jgi:hypothetical protein
MTASLNVTVTGYTGTTPPPDPNPLTDNTTLLIIAAAGILAAFAVLISVRGKTQ